MRPRHAKHDRVCNLNVRLCVQRPSLRPRRARRDRCAGSAGACARCAWGRVRPRVMWVAGSSVWGRCAVVRAVCAAMRSRGAGRDRLCGLCVVSGRLQTCGPPVPRLGDAWGGFIACARDRCFCAVYGPSGWRVRLCAECGCLVSVCALRLHVEGRAGRGAVHACRMWPRGSAGGVVVRVDVCIVCVGCGLCFYVGGCVRWGCCLCVRSRSVFCGFRHGGQQGCPAGAGFFV